MSAVAKEKNNALCNPSLRGYTDARDRSKNYNDCPYELRTAEADEWFRAFNKEAQSMIEEEDERDNDINIHLKRNQKFMRNQNVQEKGTEKIN